MRPGPHGFHVHTYGIVNNCEDTGKHFDPLNTDHGFFGEPGRHAGALGNIAAGTTGLARFDRTHSALNITDIGSTFYIIGRAVVLHLKRDDLGRGQEGSDTLVNGNSGMKIACGNIGFTGPPDADEQNP